MRQETIVSGCISRGDSEHCLNKLQRGARAAVISADPETGMKCEGCCNRHQEACVQAQVTIRTSPPGSLCSPPLPGSCDTGTISLGEHMAHCSLLQSHASLCHCRLAAQLVPLPPPSLSEREPTTQLLV